MKLFRAMVVKFSLVLSGIGALGALSISPSAAQGFLLGGMSATLGFWLTARAMEKTLQQAETNLAGDVAIAPKNKIMLATSGLQLLRTALYGAAVFKGYTLDPTGHWGCWGAIGGLFVVRVVVSVLAITGWDLKKVA